MLHSLSGMCDPFRFAGIRKWIWQMHWPKELQSIEDKCPKTWPRRKKRGVDRHYAANWTWCTCPMQKMVQNACVQISNMKENIQNVGHWRQACMNVVMKGPGSLSAAIPCFFTRNNIMSSDQDLIPGPLRIFHKTVKKQPSGGTG